MFNTDENEECRTEKDRCHNTPAIEGVQKTHDPCFIFGGTGFDDRADENLKQTAADGIDHGGDQKSREAVDQIGKHRHTDQTECATGVCEQDRFPIAELLNVFGGEQVRQQLRDEVDRDEQRDLTEGDSVRFAERDKKKRSKIDDDRLRYISDKAGEYRVLMGKFLHKMIQHF